MYLYRKFNFLQKNFSLNKRKNNLCKVYNFLKSKPSLNAFGFPHLQKTLPLKSCLQIVIVINATSHSFIRIFRKLEIVEKLLDFHQHIRLCGEMCWLQKLFYLFFNDILLYTSQFRSNTSLFEIKMSVAPSQDSAKLS